MRWKLISMLAGIISVINLLFVWPVDASLAPRDEHRNYAWHEKFWRGAGNVFTSPLEIPREIHYTSLDDGMTLGWTKGLVNGLGKGVMRIGFGMMDFFTCPFRFPDRKRAPLIEPEYPWEMERTTLS